MEPSKKIGIVGAGSWGTALALHLARNNWEIDLWVFEPELYELMCQRRENIWFLPKHKLPDSIRPTMEISQAVRGQHTVLLVTPSHVLRETVRSLKPHLAPDALVINASKGLEENNLMTLSSVIREELGPSQPLSIVSGPTFAKEVAEARPTVMVAAAESAGVAERVQNLFSTDYLRVFTSTDITGVEIGGALKNVIALAAGICDGLEVGSNARAGLITRGLVEIIRIGTAMGARPETFSGLSGLGDLFLTCTGDLSRNRTVGIKLGQGKSLDEITQGMKMVAEGIKTVKSAYHLKESLGIQASIIDECYQVLYQNKSPQKALEDLMRVEIKEEFSGVRGIE